ncbi:MAG: hypothetical protein PHI31_06420 [Desulfuromonadaceae bacterium]|nr:hypothetical protein [Desulfuromonadaceae bacterium]
MNTVWNSMCVTGEDTEINSLVLAAKNNCHKASSANTGIFSLRNLIPEPGNMFEQGKVKAGVDIETWRLNNWGTSQDLCVDGWSDRVIGRWAVRFDSHCNPPLIAIQKISALFPGLSFEIFYRSWAAGFKGTAEFLDGNCLHNEVLEELLAKRKPTHSIDFPQTIDWRNKLRSVDGY